MGIDLGTTNSLVAIAHGVSAIEAPRVLVNEHGQAMLPSAVRFSEAQDGEVARVPLVGEDARAAAAAYPEWTILSIKRLMGRSRADAERSGDLKYLGYHVVDGPRGNAAVELPDGRTLLPIEISAIILKRLKAIAERSLGVPVERAVVTVPAYFDDAQRQATRDAGRIAGLDVLRIVNEPTAAALAYGLDKRGTGTIAVYDLGGGTFDCSVLALSEGVFKVLATNGDTFLGGDDFDRALMQIAAHEMGVDLSTRDAELLQYLRDAAEQTKIALTTAESAEMRVSIPGDTPREFHREITRAEFEALIKPHIDRSIDRCRSALRDAGLTPAKVDEVVMVGGSSRIPFVRQRVAEFFGRTPHTELNPDEVVALGAAVQADILTSGRRDMILLDVIPLSLGIETLGGVVDKVIHRNSTVPARKTTRYTTGADNQTAIVLSIYQGERELTKDCRFLGTFKLSGIPPMPAQYAQVDVSFLVNQDGMLTVSAKELRSGATATVTIQPAHGLTPEEVDQLVSDSITNAEADFTERRLVELRNKATTDMRHTEKALATAGERLTPEQLAKITTAKTELQSAIAGSDLSTLQHAIDAFGLATNPLAHLLMNEVVKQALGGTNADALDATKL